jgi:hypothetical protein
LFTRVDVDAGVDQPGKNTWLREITATHLPAGDRG